MASLGARICCLDLDTFFVSVERLANPRLCHRPVVVGGRPGTRGVVTAASYEVRACGVRSGMSLTEAYQRAPHAEFVPTRHGVYGEYAEQVRAIARDYSPVVQVASIDEMYIDFSGTERLHALATHPAQPEATTDDSVILAAVHRMTAQIAEQVGLPSSAGIATSRPVAKIACRLAKPAGVRMIAAGEEYPTLAPLPVREYPGIGPVAARKLAAAGLHTLGQLADCELEELQTLFGNGADRLRQLLRGQAHTALGRDRPAFSEFDGENAGRDHDVGSISNERTFHTDVHDADALAAVLRGLSERVCWRARKRGVRATTVALKLRYSDFQTLTRQRSIAASDDEGRVFEVVSELLREARLQTGTTAGRPTGDFAPGPRPIRLLGVALSGFGRDGQLGLFDEPQRLHRVVDAIKGKFGYEALESATARSKSRKRS